MLSRWCVPQFPATGVPDALAKWTTLAAGVPMSLCGERRFTVLPRAGTPVSSGLQPRRTDSARNRSFQVMRILLPRSYTGFSFLSWYQYLSVRVSLGGPEVPPSP